MIEIEKIALVLEAVGTLMIAWTAIRVHHRVLKEHKIDRSVYQTMRKEQILGAIGMALIVIAFIIQITA